MNKIKCAMRKTQRKKAKISNRRNCIRKEVRLPLHSTIPRLAFQRLVQDILHQHGDYRFQATSLACLQEAAEYFLVQLFEDSCLTMLRAQLDRGDCSSPIDFLGEQQSAQESLQQSLEQSTKPSTVQKSSVNERKKPRKQAKPSKQENNIQKEIKKYQNSIDLLIARAPFQRLVRETLQRYKEDFRVQPMALAALQEASESYLVQLFEDSYLTCLYRSCVTLADKDMRLIQILRGPLDSGRE